MIVFLMTIDSLLDFFVRRLTSILAVTVINPFVTNNPKVRGLKQQQKQHLFCL